MTVPGELFSVLPIAEARVRDSAVWPGNCAQQEGHLGRVAFLVETRETRLLFEFEVDCTFEWPCAFFAVGNGAVKNRGTAKFAEGLCATAN